MRFAVGPLGLLLTLVQLSQQVPEPNRKDYYVGAVVEFAPYVNYKDGPATLEKNVNSYADFAKQAKQQDADIIVFPEDGLTSYSMPGKPEMDPWTTVIPSPKEEYVPCTGDRSGVSQTLKKLSCAALTNSIYLVANIAEKGCPNGNAVECPDNRTIYHNTNVAFDRKGKIIARYRKVNLYNEPQFEVVNPPEVITFDTDFGVKFGTFICFDILFPVPALNLTRQLGVTDIVYSTAWFSEAPFLTAVQTQYGWSYGENANLLAAGYNNPQFGSAGSGIYLGTNGIADATITERSQSRLLVSRVPKKTPPSRPDVLSSIQKDPSTDKPDSCYNMNAPAFSYHGVLIKRDNIQPYQTVPLNETSFNETVCKNDLCCNFRGSKASDGNEKSTIYRAVVYNGCRIYGRSAQADIRVCAVTQCLNESVSSCGIINPSSVTFNNIEITTTIRNSTRVLLALPNALNSSLLPFQSWTYSKEKVTTEKATRYTITLKEPTSDISTFGIYMRDVGKETNGTGELFSLSTIVFSILMSAISLLANRH